MVQNPIVIIGGGLSGLLIAYQLKQRNIPFSLIEARDRPGGRIHTLLGKNNTPLEMGATWFGDKHTHLKQLLNELQIGYFVQFMEGTAFYEEYTHIPARKMLLPVGEPSYRIEGGTIALIQRLAQELEGDEIMLGQQVQELIFEKERVKITTQTHEIQADVVISTLPPALLIHSIKMQPAIPEELAKVALQTNTWMQDAIKAALVYERPFWREKGLSGTLFSIPGPVIEYYDHSNHDNTLFALCGFIHGNLRYIPAEERKQAVVQHLKHFFGEEATNYQTYEEVVWADQAYTKHQLQEGTETYPHQHNGHPVFRSDFFNGHLMLAGTETAVSFPGYMEGAVISATHTIETLVSKVPQPW